MTQNPNNSLETDDFDDTLSNQLLRNNGYNLIAIPREEWEVLVRCSYKMKKYG